MSNEDTSDFVWKTTTGSGFTVTVKDRDLRWMIENNKNWQELQMLRWNTSPEAHKAEQDYFALPIDYSYTGKYGATDLLGIKKPYWKW